MIKSHILRQHLSVNLSANAFQTLPSLSLVLSCLHRAPTLAMSLNAEAGFRKEFNTVDHLFTFSQLREKFCEHQLPLWTAALDFQKAFDTIDHHGVWASLLEQGVQTGYVKLLQKLYTGQTGRVRLDKLSKPFSIERGTKQGDPLSSLLFNAVLTAVFNTDI